MRISPQNLLSHLQNALKFLYFVYGHEPLQHQQSLNQLRSIAQKSGYCERERYQIESQHEWPSLITHLKTASLFSENRLIELHLPEKLNTTLEDQLNHLLPLLPLENCLIIISHFSSDRQSDRKIENTFWFKNIENKGVIIPCKPSDHQKLGVFDLIDAAMTGDAKQILVILQHLQKKGEVEPYLIIWALQKATQKISFQQKIPQETINIELQAIDEIIKGRRIGNAWQAVSRFLLKLSGADFLESSLVYPFEGSVS